ncbi:MAG: hypothetical protein Phyf2KO_26230 [Phycisphaerales bacterium]
MRTLICAAAVFGLSFVPAFGIGEVSAQQFVKPRAAATVASRDWSADKMGQILDRALTFRSEAKYAEATIEILSLWDCPIEQVDDEMHQIRGMAAFFAEGITEEHAPSQRAFFKLRERLGQELQSDEVDLFTVHDWVRMNGVIDDGATSMYFYDHIKNNPEAASMLQITAPSLVFQAFDERRWDVLAELVTDPATAAQNLLEISVPMLGVTEEQLGCHPFDAPEWVAGLLQNQIIAALHTDDNGAKERELIKVFETNMKGHDAWRVTFIYYARMCGKVRKDHLEWLGEYNLLTKFAHDPTIMQLKAGARSSR